MIRFVALIFQIFILFLTVIWIVGFFLHKKEFFNSHQKTKGKFPSITFAISAFNEEKSIEKCIKSLLNVDYPKDKIDIIIVNDGSKDKTSSVVKKIISKNPQRKIRFIDRENKGKARSLNEALELAKGDFFCSVDADSFLSPKSMREIIGVFEKEGEKTASVVPLIKVRNSNKVLEKSQKIEYASAFITKKVVSAMNSVLVINGPCSCIRTKILKKVGGYDEDNLTEDVEIAFRLQKYDYKISVANTYVETICPSNFKDFFKQRKRWETGSALNYTKYFSLIFSKRGDFSIVASFYWFLLMVLFFYFFANFFAPLAGFGYLYHISDYSISQVLTWFNESYVQAFLNGLTLFAYIILFMTFICWAFIIFATYKFVLKEKFKITDIFVIIWFIVFYGPILALTKIRGAYFALTERGNRKW